MDVDWLIGGIVSILIGVAILILGIVSHARGSRRQRRERAVWPFVACYILGVVVVVTGAVMVFQSAG
jgi:uncharacterized membrane protein YidH (DUF202 family)